ncbi:MAG: hypothetical protein PWQ22_1637 [Archaeoglobaceae archaeon]|nr:hypothetical protein [Archaeoglobaceae archaeon]
MEEKALVLKGLLEKAYRVEAEDLGFELSERAEEFRFTDKRIFNEIYELELSAKSLYEQIAANFEDLLGEKIGLLRELAKEEEMHAKLVERFVDKTMRII